MTEPTVKQHNGMQDHDPDIQKLQSQIFVSKVTRAQQLSIGERIAEGAELFDQNMLLMRGFVRGDNPDFSVEQVEAEVGRRLRLAKKLSDRGFYRNIKADLDDQS